MSRHFRYIYYFRRPALQGLITENPFYYWEIWSSHCCGSIISPWYVQVYVQITPNPRLCHQLLKKDEGKAWVRWANQRLCTQKAQHKYQNGLVFLMLPTKYTKVKVLVESLWWQRLNCSKQGIKAEIDCYKKIKGSRGKVETHTGSKIGFPWFSKSETESRWRAVKTNCSRDGWRPGLKATR